MLSAVNAVNLVNTVNAVKMLPPSGGVLSQVSLPFLLSSFSYQLSGHCTKSPFAEGERALCAMSG